MTIAQERAPQIASGPDLSNGRTSRLARPALRLLLVSGTIAAIWLAAASRWIATGTVVPWDSKNQFYAFFRFLGSALASGATPFWNPYHFGGHPAIADPQSLVLAPVFVLWAWLDPAPTMRAFDLVVYAHLLAGGLAIGAIGRRAGWPAAACVLTAAVFMFGGAASARLQHTASILTYALFPPALLCLQVALDRRSYCAAGTFALVGAMLLIGRNQVALLFAFVLAGFVLAEILGAARPWTYVRERFGVIAVMALGASLLAAAPILLTIQFAALSNRPEVGLERALEGSLYPVNLATLAVANVFGSNNLPTPAWPYPYWGPNYDTVPDVATTDLSMNYLFVGVLPVILVLWFGIAGGGAWRRGRRILTIALVLVLLFTLGRYTPFFAWAFEWVPGVAKFRRPVDGNFALVALLALLAGHLLADYVRDGMPRTRPLALILVAATAIGTLGWAVVFSMRSHRAMEAAIEIAKILPLAAAAVLVLGLSRSPVARRWAATAVVAVTVAELLWWNTASRLNAEEQKHYAVLERPGENEAQAVGVLQRALRERHRQGERPRVEIVGAGGAWQNLAMVAGLEATNGYNPLRIGFYDRLVAPGETTYLVQQRQFPRSFTGYDCALARALGIEYVVLGVPVEQAPPLRPKNFDLLHSSANLYVYRLRHATPRVVFSRRVQVADAGTTDAAGQPLADPSPDQILIDDDTPPTRTYVPAAGSGVSAARIVAWRPDRIEIDVESAQGGVLALHDTYYPGWVAEVDSVRTRIMRADVLFRAVEVPPGRRRVVFRYAPLSLENLRAAFATALRR